MNLSVILQKLVQRQNLTEAEMTAIMTYIMSGQATPAQIAGLLIAFRMKGETVVELTAAAKVMRQLAIPVKLPTSHLVDIVGTGGDQTHTFNISTASAFVVAAAGGKVAKHGGRAVSSHSGSADVLESAGVNLHLTPEQIAECVKQIGVGFLFAPKHHSVMQYVSSTRRELGIRTLFNLLGPLTNPAGAKYQVMGVFDAVWLEPCASVLQQLGIEHALVVHAEDGLDEISISAATEVAELKQQHIKRYRITPELFGLQRAVLSQIQVQNVAQSLQLLKDALNNIPGAARDIVALNAAAAIYVAGLTEDLASAVQRALTVIASGSAAQKLHDLVVFTQRF
ncbi:MAG: anthranilate phosphoribosyltransferase [Gammaproteobacteria bacterium]